MKLDTLTLIKDTNSDQEASFPPLGKRDSRFEAPDNYFTYLQDNYLMHFYKDSVNVLSGGNGDLSDHHYMPSNNSEDLVKGSDGWSRICSHPAYHIGHESEALSDHSIHIADILGKNATVIDYGVGDEKGLEKTFAVMKDLKKPYGYVALDYNKDYAESAAKSVSKKFSSLRFSEGHSGDFMDFKVDNSLEKKVGLCFGGTIVNTVEEKNNDRGYLIAKLEQIRKNLGKNSYFIVSQDINQSPEKLVQGYNADLCGSWQLNIFHRIIRDLKVQNLDPNAFVYKSEWRQSEYCYAHCAVATIDQNITIGSRKISIKKGSVFDMTRSYKYPLDIFRQALESAGWAVKKSFIDANHIAYHICKSRD